MKYIQSDLILDFRGFFDGMSELENKNVLLEKDLPGKFKHFLSLSPL